MAERYNKTVTASRARPRRGHHRRHTGSPQRAALRTGETREGPQTGCGLLGRTEAGLTIPIAHLAGVPVARVTAAPYGRAAVLRANRGSVASGLVAAR
jgi:hypothetical protein